MRGSVDCPALYAAIRKHGATQFIIAVAGTADGQQETDSLERHLIARHGTIVPRGYNFHEGGNGQGVHRATKLKISESLSGRKREPFSEAHRAALSAAHKGIGLGIKRPPEVGEKIRAAKLGKKRPDLAARMNGRALSDSHRASLREAWRRRPDRMMWTRGRTVNQERRAAISATLSGRKLSPEHIAAIRAGKALKQQVAKALKLTATILEQERRHA